MENIQWEKINLSDFNIFIRDLSESLNVNLKHIIEDLYMNQPKIINKKKGKNNKKKIIKKKDIIIQEQNKKREIKIINEELNYINYFIKNIQNENPYLNFNFSISNGIPNRFNTTMIFITITIKYYLFYFFSRYLFSNTITYFFTNISFTSIFKTFQ